MLIKEYRIPLPLTVEEYRIAQLYMIAKKSREESSGAGSGVEILINEPYEDGPGGKGQYTKKIYHIGSHLPGWMKSILPKTALMVEEEAWNAYPYTKTRYTCPFVEKFFLEIETYYYADNGHQENVFKLTGSDLRNRIIDTIDVVKDQLYGADYQSEEDPLLYVSEKTGRGPLTDNWLKEYWDEVKEKPQPTASGKALMCAYKLCRVEFRYWGMQTKIEKFIHDIALRKTMLRAHRQAWAWQDEWYGLTMEDIREIERQTQMALKRKMRQALGNDLTDGEDDNSRCGSPAGKEDPCKTLAATLGSIEMSEDSPLLRKNSSNLNIRTEASSDADISADDEFIFSDEKGKYRSNKSLHSPCSVKSFDHVVDQWRIETLERESESPSDEEFFDCEEDSIFAAAFLQRIAGERLARRPLDKCIEGHQLSISRPDSPHSEVACSISVLVLVFHAGSVLDVDVETAAKNSDVTTFRTAFENVMRQHYPSLLGHIVMKLVNCPAICTESLGILSSLSPYSFDLSPSVDKPQVTHDSIPIGAISIFATSGTEHDEAVSRTITAANVIYQEFLKSDEGHGFSGQVCLVADSVGSILAYDALCRTNSSRSHSNSESRKEDLKDNIMSDEDHLLSNVSCPPQRRCSSAATLKLEFEVSDFFLFGSPLAVVLAYRIMSSHDKSGPVRPACSQVYNMFHPTDPVASRLEPLLSAKFSSLAPVNVARYAKYPLGNGQPYHLLETLQSSPQMFVDQAYSRRLSDVSIQSTVSGLIECIPLHTVNALQQKWWGNRRLDYALYCPEGLSNFPSNALPHLFHASYWESCDVIAFILRQIGGGSGKGISSGYEEHEFTFKPGQPREKWNKKRTSVKLKNVAANHRANDVIVQEGAPQVLSARFMYGPLDMITLTGEKVDIYVMKDTSPGEWTFLSTEVTDKTGRVSYTIPEDKSLNFGIHPIKMVVKGDHTYVDFFLVVIPPKTECVVFSIDGSFTASVSVTGRDPKVRAGAVDIVRYWQELGYLIIYVTGRPDMQHRKVVSWLSQHNFPHGLVSFADGLSTDPLGHKAVYLKNLIENHGMVVYHAYGSAKDISVYTSIGLSPKEIFIVGKVSKKQQSQATVLSEGQCHAGLPTEEWRVENGVEPLNSLLILHMFLRYATHLVTLMGRGGARPAQGNARMVINRGCFGLPGQAINQRRRSAKRTTSYPISPTPELTPTDKTIPNPRKYYLPKNMFSSVSCGNKESK